jgi:uncharacterized membrane protein YGL010W
MAAMLKPKITALFEDYAQAHRTPGNRMTHKIAIPIIVFHIVAMLDWVRLVSLPGGHVLTLGAVAFAIAAGFWLSWDLKLGLLVSLATLLAFPLGWVAPRALVIVLAALGWLVQLAGHAIWEKNRPSFMKNMVHALIGPIFFVALLVGEWPARKAAQPA